jgi:hypothetical protein
LGRRTKTKEIAFDKKNYSPYIDEIQFTGKNKDFMIDNQRITDLYAKAVEEPNKNSPKRGFVKCPECGEEILMVPTLRVMNQAIETHVQIHKEQLKENPIKEHSKAIRIRLTLMGQVLKQAGRLQAS